jgi:GIY-YIG catalytic domain
MNNMNLKDLIKSNGIDPQHVLVLRHRPWETLLHKMLPFLASEKPELFNAYQQTQDKQVEGEMARAKYVASFIGHEPGKALFVGLYARTGEKPISRKQFLEIPANVELKAFGMNGFTEEESRSSFLLFDLVLTDFYAHWKGKLIIGWPPLDKNWHRWAHKPKNEMPVIAVLEDSALNSGMPEWHEIDLRWEQLSLLPTSWKLKLQQWRGIYYVVDTSDGKGYVGSAYGKNNLLGRWQNYAARGDGGNRLLRQRDRRNFRFTILELDAPNRDASDVVRLESSWKARLHTRKPHGLNDN